MKKRLHLLNTKKHKRAQKMEKCFDRGITVSQYKEIIYGEVA